MKHTPGPWRHETRIKRGTYSQPVKGNPVSHYVTGSRPNQNYTEPIICHLGPMNECSEANARLIAAAPDLLDALQKISKELKTSNDRMKMIETIETLTNAAIAKAEGKS